MQLKTAETQETAKTARIGETARTADFKFQTAKKTSNLLKTTAKEPLRGFSSNFEGNWWTARRSSLPNPDLIGATVCPPSAAPLIPSGPSHLQMLCPIATKLQTFTEKTTGHLPSKFQQNQAAQNCAIAFPPLMRDLCGGITLLSDIVERSGLDHWNGKKTHIKIVQT